jgi:uncharacterized protein
MERRIPLDSEQLAGFCRRWRITELAFFGSVLRADFRPDSDIDVLVTFAPDAGHSLFDLINLQEELQSLLGRRVDIVEKRALRNPFSRQEILRTQQVVYGA